MLGRSATSNLSLSKAAFCSAVNPATCQYFLAEATITFNSAWLSDPDWAVGATGALWTVAARFSPGTLTESAAGTDSLDPALTGWLAPLSVPQEAKRRGVELTQFPPA